MLKKFIPLKPLQPEQPVIYDPLLSMRLTKTEYIYFLFLINNINSYDEERNITQNLKFEREHCLAAVDVAHFFFRRMDNNVYPSLKNLGEKMLNLSIDDQELNKSYPLCSRCHYHSGKGFLEVVFTEEVMRYLSFCRERFNNYNIKELAPLKSFFSMKLFEMLAEHKKKGEWEVSIDRFKAICGVEDKYSKPAHFRQGVLKVACAELNSLFDINLSYEDIYRGKKGYSIKFTFKEIRIANGDNTRTWARTPEFMKNIGRGSV